MTVVVINFGFWGCFWWVRSTVVWGILQGVFSVFAGVFSHMYPGGVWGFSSGSIFGVFVHAMYKSYQRCLRVCVGVFDGSKLHGGCTRVVHV